MENTDWPIEEERIKFSSKNDLMRFVENWKKKGHFKKCTHLETKEVDQSYWNEYFCRPVCTQKSFDLKRESSGNQKSFYGCPKDCRLYQASWVKNVKGVFAKLFFWFRIFINWTVFFWNTFCIPLINKIKR